MSNTNSSALPLQVIAAEKHYRQGSVTVTALDGVDLNADSGEIVAIMGSSGSGKSTLLHAMAGLISLDGGKVLIEGTDLSELSDARMTRFRGRSIGMIFQAFNLIPSLSAEANICLPAPNNAETDARCEFLLDRLGLQSRRHHKPDAMSGGEQQRVAVARALICHPTIVLADEPTGSLDSVTGQALCRLLRELSEEEQRTIVLVTHEPQVAMWADRVVVLKDGKKLSEFPVSLPRSAQDIANQFLDVVRLPSEVASCPES